jgi:hypothetical protein
VITIKKKRKSQIEGEKKERGKTKITPKTMVKREKKEKEKKGK